MGFFDQPRALCSFGVRSWPTFQLCGVTGLLAGSTLACLIAEKTGFEAGIVLLLAILSLLVFLLLAYSAKWSSGRESLSYYPVESAAMLLAVPLLFSLDRPPLPYLDLLAIGLAGTYALIRLGCHHAGCCHGKVARRGVCYGLAHVAEGFSAAYAGLPLFPVQAIESLIVATLSVVCSYLFLLGTLPSGSVLCVWLGAYAVARFCLELQRADAETPFWLFIAKAQWSALARGLFAAGFAVWLGSPVLPWLAAGAALLLVAGAALVLQRSFGRATSNPREIHQIAQALSHAEAASESTSPPRLWYSPKEAAHGLLFSCGSLEKGKITHVTLSGRADQITPDAVAAMATTVRALRPGLAAPRLLASGSGIVHLLFERMEH